MHDTQFSAQIFLGLYMLYSGLNAFFHFRKLPPQSKEMQTFIQHLESTRLILPMVKIVEILGGLGLLLNWMPRLCLALLTPVIFFIVLAQIRFNREKSFGVCCLILIPFILAAYPFDSWYAFFASPLLNP